MSQPAQPSALTIRIHRFNLAVAKHWLRIALTVIGLYAGLPFVAPTLMKLGFNDAANILYTVYSPMCHQFAFRSIFLYGEQPFYPREIAGVDPEVLRPYEAYATEVEGLNVGTSPTDFTPAFWLPARAFRGNEQMGYKTTLCARDAAIYVAMFLGGLIYAIPPIRKRLRPIPLWIYVIAGLGPIGLDGFSQLLSYIPFQLWAVRETEPFFRVSTGAMFGLMNAWLAFPYLELSFRETRWEIERKFYFWHVPL